VKLQYGSHGRETGAKEEGGVPRYNTLNFQISHGEGGEGGKLQVGGDSYRTRPKKTLKIRMKTALDDRAGEDFSRPGKER